MASTVGMINETIYHLSELSNQNMPILFTTGGNAKPFFPIGNTKFYLRRHWC